MENNPAETESYVRLYIFDRWFTPKIEGDLADMLIPSLYRDWPSNHNLVFNGFDAIGVYVMPFEKYLFQHVGSNNITYYNGSNNTRLYQMQRRQS